MPGRTTVAISLSSRTSKIGTGASTLHFSGARFEKRLQRDRHQSRVFTSEQALALRRNTRADRLGWRTQLVTLHQLERQAGSYWLTIRRRLGPSCRKNSASRSRRARGGSPQ